MREQCDPGDLPPGRLHPAERYIYGAQTLLELGSSRANQAIIGAGGMDAAGAHDIDDQAAGAYRAMIRQAEQTALLADHSKFGSPALARIAPWAEIDALTSDAEPPAAIATALAAAQVSVAQEG